MAVEPNSGLAMPIRPLNRASVKSTIDRGRCSGGSRLVFTSKILARAAKPYHRPSFERYMAG